MPAVSHCRHCYGDCSGVCLLPGGQGLCIHNPYPKLTFRERLAFLGNGRFWRRVYWGERGGRSREFERKLHP